MNCAGFDPPLVRGDDGEYYFAVLGRDSDGEVYRFYLPAPVEYGWLVALNREGKRLDLCYSEEKGDPLAARGRFVTFRAFPHALTFEARHGGDTVYVPVSGRWLPGNRDPGRYVFALRAAPGVPDSRALEYWTLDTFLGPGQTYHYRTQKELAGGTGSGALGALGGLGLLAGWWFSLWGLGLTLSAAASGYSIPAGTLAAVLLIVVPTVGGTAWLIRRWRQEKSPHYLEKVPDITPPREGAARREGEGSPQHGAEAPPAYLG